MKESPDIPARPIGHSVQNPERDALSTRRQEFNVAPPKRSHWIVFLVVCCLLGLLVFKTVLHVISTDTKKARIVHAPSPVETIPVRRQTLEEVIGGSGTVEQFNPVLLTTQISARVLEVPVKIGDIVKKGDLLVRWDDRLIQATLESNRQLVASGEIKIKDETRQVKQATQAAIDNGISRFVSNVRFPYRFEAGKKPFFVRAMYHDDKFTYVQARPEESPTLYEIKDGKPNLVNFDYKNGVYVVDKILDRGYLVIGKQKLGFLREE